jgi:hypothetical protein
MNALVHVQVEFDNNKRTEQAEFIPGADEEFDMLIAKIRASVDKVVVVVCVCVCVFVCVCVCVCAGACVSVVLAIMVAW